MYVYLSCLIVTTGREFPSNHGCVFKANLDSTKYVRDSNHSFLKTSDSTTEQVKMISCIAQNNMFSLKYMTYRANELSSY